MSTLALELDLEPCRARERDDELEAGAQTHRAPSRDAAAGASGLGGESSLDALVSGMWEGLAAHRSVACPLCGGQMAPAYGAHAKPIGGRCMDCETTIG